MRNYSVQKMRKGYTSPLRVAIKYYQILSALNNLKLAKREIELMAFTAIRGTISSSMAKNTFIDQFGSSKATIGNIIYKLSKIGLLVKDGDGRVVVNPGILVDFNNNIVIQLKLEIDEKTT